MQIHTEIRGSVGIITCEGKMLIGEGDEMLREAVNRLVDGGTSQVLLDLSGVPYVDACGLAEMVRCYTTTSRAGGTLALLGLTKRLHDLLSITKLLTVFKTFKADQKEQALAWLQDFNRS